MSFSSKIKEELNRVLNAYLAMKIVNVDIFEPLPSSIYEITDEDIQEIDELMPKSELESTLVEETVEEVKTEIEKVEEKVDVEVEENVDTSVVEIDSTSEMVQVSEETFDENLEEAKKEEVVVIEKEEETDNDVKVNAPIENSTSNNKGSKEFLVNKIKSFSSFSISLTLTLSKYPFVKA